MRPCSPRSPTGLPVVAKMNRGAASWSAAAACGSYRRAASSRGSCSCASTSTPANTRRSSGWRRRSRGVRCRPSDCRPSLTSVFDEASERVVARKRLMWEDLVIEETPAHLPAGDRVAAVLAEAALTRMDRAVPGDPYLTRLRWLKAAMPDADLPDADLGDVVRDLCTGRKSLAELRAADWASAIAARLTHRQRQLIDREAPERWTVPSGSSLALTYEVGKPPVLAVRIQEMFGLADTPRVAGGRVKVLLHLLAPNGRPQQVTDDLASFWANTYQIVRKDLRARYPKHAWPEDPWTEPPRRGRKPK